MLSGSKAAMDEARQRHDQMEQINQSINVNIIISNLLKYMIIIIKDQ